MPDVEFRIQPFPDAGLEVRMFASAGDSGFELVLEGLPVEIRLPAGLVQPHPDAAGGPDGELVIERGEFRAGRLDDLRVVYRRIDPTSIFVHVRILMSEACEFHIQPVVPVSFERCGLSGIPCTAIHDFRLIASPELAPDHFEWLRHPVDPILPSHTATHDGLFSVRSVDIDETADGVADVVQWLNGHATDKDPTAELVLGDLVVPFQGPLLLPVPRHLTVGLRRKVLDPASIGQVFAFERAPVHIALADDLAFIVESLFYRSQPAHELPAEPEPKPDPGGDPDALGLTFSAALVWGEDESPQQGLEIGLDEDYTIVTGYKRDFSTSDGLPDPGTGAQRVLNGLLHWEIAGTVLLDVMSVRAGLSLGRKFVQERSFSDSTLLTCDLFVSMPSTGDDDAWFRLRTLRGEKVAFAMEGLGWRLGGLHLEGLALPDGVVAHFGSVAFIITEFGLSAEEGASYLSFSGGLQKEFGNGVEAAFTVKRLRFRVAGDDSRPLVKLDGFFLRAHNKDKTIAVEAGGYYSATTTGDTRVREFGFTGTIAFKYGVSHYTIGVDVLAGDVRSPADSFDYLMVQAFLRGHIGPLGGVELTGLRVLYARNMLPKLSELDLASRELRYYKWYRENDPLRVPGDRRLTSWRAEHGAWAFGAGATASLPGFGKLVELTIFVLAVEGASEDGMLIVGELFVLANPRPLGYLAAEIDQRNDRVSLLIGIDARASSFVQNAPAWMDAIGTLGGTLFISNDPGTVAIGRLADQSTWLALRFDVDLWVQTSLLVGLCLELVEGGPKGFAMTLRVEGGIGKRGVVRLTYNAGWGFVLQFFSTGSSDYAVAIWIEAGIRFVLFGFLRIGISARIEFRVVGSRPARGELSAELRLETPWFLPDVTWRLECQFGELAPSALNTAVQPLRSAGALEPATGRQLATHLERFDPGWNGEGVAPVHSVDELRAPTRPEPQRLANLAADAALVPVATDATISVVWSVAVNDKLALGSGMASGLGDQRSGDLGLTYDLVAISVRRRARFGTDRAWKDLDQRVELGVVFGPGGVQLDGSFAPQIMNKTWDVDVRVAGVPAPKKLLLNGVAPYAFTTSSPEADEALVRSHPGWPCCKRPDDKDLGLRVHALDWHAARAGVTLGLPASWRFTDAHSALRFLRPAWSHPAAFGGLAPATVVAAAEPGAPGVLARADLDEDAAFCSVTMAWPRALRVTLVAFDGAGKRVAREELGGGSEAHRTTMLHAQGPIRRLELRTYLPSAPGVLAMASAPRAAFVEIDRITYVGLADYLDLLTAQAACDGGAGGGMDGSGKLALLPNNEYEVKLTTRVTVAHPSTAAASADVEEFVYVRTKGLPGLNAVTRTGEEVEPYVRAAYAGGRGGLVYREEPVTVAFSEGFHVAVPLASRPPGSAAEQTKLLRMQLLATPDIAAAGETVYTATGDDWIATHHRGTPPPVAGPGGWRPVRTRSSSSASAMLSSDPRSGASR